MKILIAGGTGFIGQALVKAWTKHDLTVMGRNTEFNLQSLQQLSDEEFATFDVVINLTGANIGAKRWSDARKKEILDSRVDATTTIATRCAKLGAKAPRLMNASAIGVYGLQPNQKQGLPPALDENTPIDFNDYSEFSAQVCRKWESATTIASDAGVAVTITRFAVVLGPGGALKKLKLPYLLGLGGPIASGQQPFCWVALEDVERAMTWLLEHPEVTGPVNIVSPNTVTQKEFAKTFGKVLCRPAFMPTPALALKILFGQMAEELLLHGQHVVPTRLKKLGFEFTYPDLVKALK